MESHPVVNLLPAEILIEIFVHTYPTIELHNRVSLPPASQVNRRWRSCICSYPDLWSRLSIKWDAYEDKITTEGAAFIAATDTCLRRSGTQVLSFTVAADEDECVYNGEHFRFECRHTVRSSKASPVISSVIDLFVEHCRRWRDARLNVHFPYVLPHLPPKQDEQFQALHTLSLYQGRCMGRSSIGYSISLDPTHLFESAENLDSLSLNGFILFIKPHLPATITRYSCIYNWTAPYLMPSHMPNLAHLKILDNNIAFYREPSDLTNFQLDAVTSLYLGASPRCIAGHLDVLTLPKMEKLFLLSHYFDRSHGSEQIMVDALLSLLQRSSCTLKTLTITVKWIDSIMQFLDSIPTLCRIHFKMIRALDEDLQLDTEHDQAVEEFRMLSCGAANSSGVVLSVLIWPSDDEDPQEIVDIVRTELVRRGLR